MLSRVLLLLIASVFAIGNLGSFSLFSQSRVYYVDCITLILTAIFLFKSPIYYKTLTKSILLFGFIAGSTLILHASTHSGTATIVASLYLLRWITYGLLFVSFIQLSKYIKPTQLLNVIGWSFVVLCLLQYILLPDIRFLSDFGWDPHYYRIVGPLLDPGFTGILLVFILLSQLTWPFPSRLARYSYWLLTYLAFALTYSRASYLALAAGLTIFFLATKQLTPWLIYMGVLTMTVVLLLLLPRPQGEGVKLERTSTIVARVYNWQSSWKIFLDHPLTGVGFNFLRYDRPEPDSSSHSAAGADSSLVFVASTTGLIGLACYLYYLSSLARIPKLPTFLGALLIHSLFLNSLFYIYVLFYIGILLAVIHDTRR